MTCKEVMEQLALRWDPSYALTWDNVGLLVGREEKEIHRIFVALDVTEATLEQAIAFGADLMITHHPMLFSPIKKITSQDFMGRRLLRMIQADLCCYAMHTNFDVMGMAELNEKALALQETSVLEVTGTSVKNEKEVAEGIGRIGMLEKPKTLQEFAMDVKEAFQIPDVRVYGDANRVVCHVAVSSGSGKSMVTAALEKKADVIVTGDMDYHSCMDAVAQGLMVIDAGHYGTEYGFISYVSEVLKEMLPETAVGEAKVQHPYQVV